jgi:hypothetical protein
VGSKSADLSPGASSGLLNLLCEQSESVHHENQFPVRAGKISKSPEVAPFPNVVFAFGSVKEKALKDIRFKQMS